jgi:hypothetical protein
MGQARPKNRAEQPPCLRTDCKPAIRHEQIRIKGSMHLDFAFASRCAEVLNWLYITGTSGSCCFEAIFVWPFAPETGTAPLHASNARSER